MLDEWTDTLVPINAAGSRIEAVTTANKGRTNIMTMSWHMMMEFNPHRISCIIGPWDYSFEALQATKECVIAIPTFDLATKVVEIGNCSGQHESGRRPRFRAQLKPSTG